MRDSHHSTSLMSHAVLAHQLVSREAFDGVFRENNLPKAEIDLPTAPASDIPTPSTVSEAEASEHAKICLGSRAQGFSGPHVRSSVAANR